LLLLRALPRHRPPRRLPSFTEIRRRYQQRNQAIDRPSVLLYQIVDGLVGSFFPIRADFDNRIDELEDQIFRAASDKQLSSR
jgi:Mg2+ and Co2+ transporter CorA